MFIIGLFFGIAFVIGALAFSGNVDGDDNE